MLALLTIAGGVALLLFGVRYLRKGLDRLFGERLGLWMNRLARTKGSSFLSGLAVSVAAPSSTTVSLLAVETVQAGHMTSRQMLAVMLGANIGLTVMVQLIALNVDAIAPILILVGMVLFRLTSRARLRGTGRVLLSLGFIFLAMSVIRSAVEQGNLAAHDDFQELIGIATRYPLLLTLVATVLTILLQSGTATLGLVIGLGAGGAVSLDVVVPAVVGANVGMSATTLIVGWQQIDSRRLAWGNLLLKAVVGAVVLGVYSIVGDQLRPAPAAYLPGLVANLHTGFNVLLAAAGMPALGVVSSLMERLVPPPSGDGQRVFGPKFIRSGPIESMSLAMGQSLREIMHMAEIIRSMLDDVWKALKTNNERLVRSVSDRDDQVDILDAALKRFLTQLVREETDEIDADEQLRQLRYISELETIGDIIDKNICELVLKKIRLGAQFSEAGAKELNDFYGKVVENLEIAVTAFTTRDRTLAQQLMRHKERLNSYESELRDRHFQRLSTGTAEAMETSAIHLDLLTHLRRINSALTHVAYAILLETDASAERAV